MKWLRGLYSRSCFGLRVYSVLLLFAVGSCSCALIGRPVMNGPYKSQPWSYREKINEATWQGIHFLDFLQTEKIASHPDLYHEVNPLLGPHPSKGKVALYFASGALVHLGVTSILPPPYREAFQYTTLVYSSGCVTINFLVGLGP
jgi:hypothetical protein